MQDFKAESYNLKPEVSSNSMSDDDIETESNEEYIVLDLHSADDLKRLDKAFGKIKSTLDEQRNKLAAKWRCKAESQSDENDGVSSHKGMQLQQKLLIDLQCILARILRIGMLEGKKYRELENEQNKAIAKLQTIVGLEEDARVASNKALQLAKETEEEMKEIDRKRQIIADKLKHAEPELAAARLAVTDIDDRALNELLSLKKPPRTVTNVLTVAVWIVNSASSSNTVGNGSKNKRRSSSNNNTKSKSINNRKTRSRAQSQSINVALSQSALKPIDESICKAKASPRQGNAIVRPQSAKSGCRRSKSRGRSQSRNSFGGAGVATVAEMAISSSSSSLSGAESRPRSRSRSRSNSQSKARKGSKHMNKIDKLKSRDVDKILTQSWGDTRVMLTRGNFKKSVLEFEPKTLPKNVHQRIEKEFLTLEDFTVLRANQASKVLGPLVKWILSIIGYTTIWYSLEPMAEQVSELETVLAVKQIKLIKVKNIAKESQAKVIEIRTEMLRMVGYHKIGDLYFLS